MFGSLLKGMFFLTTLGFCAFVAVYFSGLSGTLTLSVNDSELSLSILEAIGMAGLIMLLLSVTYLLLKLFVALIRFLSGAETAISRYFTKSRQAKGQKALLNALISLYEGDSSDALVQSGRAKYLLKNSSLSLLINTQIAQQAGEKKTVLSNYKRLLLEKDTRLVALSGIVSEKIKAGDFKAALTLTQRSVQLNPKNINEKNVILLFFIGFTFFIFSIIFLFCFL